MTAEDQASLEPILRISPTAREKLLEVKADDPQHERLVLRLEVTGVVDGEYTYNRYFQLREAVAPTDTSLGDDDIATVIPPVWVRSDIHRRGAPAAFRTSLPVPIHTGEGSP